MTGPDDGESRASPTVTAPVRAAPHGWRARLDLRFTGPSGATRLAHNRHHGPLRLLKALAAEDGRALEAVVVHPPGGLAGGDDLRIVVQLDAGARVLATTPGAQKWYRTADAGTASAATVVALGTATVLEWLPQPSIIYDRADAHQQLAIAMASDACCIGWEITILGRAAMGERFRTGRLAQSIGIDVDGVPLWHERLSAGAADRLFSSPVGWNGHTVAATVWCCAPAWTTPRLAALRDRWRELAGVDGTSASATLVADALVLSKMLGDDSERLQSIAQSLWRAARISLDGDAGAPPRIWRT